MQGSTHISSPDTGPVQMVPERSPPALALLLPTLQMAGEAEEGPGGVGAAVPQLRQLAHLSLGRPGRAPGEPLPTLLRLCPRPHPASPLSPPLPRFTTMGRREESWLWLGVSLNPCKDLVGEVALASFGRWGN